MPAPKQSAATLITELDGRMIPIVVPPATGADRRRGQQHLWREARLCLARPADSVTSRYGATLGSVALVGALWRATARAASLGARTQVHGVGDGAAWILTQFQEQFGAPGRYLVDFYHVSEKLAAAAPVIRPRDPVGWRRRQQGRLLQNNVEAVLRALARHVESETAGEQPVRDAQRYLSERRARGLCINSGEVESGHRHVIQQRLKRAGSWWTEPHAEAMLGLRAARANDLWDRYWLTSELARN